MTMLSPQERLEVEDRTLSRIIGWINTSDAKVAGILAFQTALVAYILTKSADIKQILLQHQIDALSFWLVLSLGLFLWFIFWSVFHAFKALYPDVKPRGRSLLFFGTITSYGLDSFKEELSELTDDRLEEDIASQIFINSQIASAKFDRVKRSIQDLGLAASSWVISLVVISLLS